MSTRLYNPLVEKSLATNARKGTREAATECLLGWAMSEADGNKGEGIVCLWSPSHQHQTDLKTLPQMFAHADKGVREEVCYQYSPRCYLKFLKFLMPAVNNMHQGRLLVQTIYQFLGAALERGAQAALKASTSQNDPEGMIQQKSPNHNGLSSEFAKYRSLMVVPILKKFKEKRVNVVEALGNCLDAMAVTVTLSDLNEEF
ncbi:hypothetical protein H4Q26_008297 [Puccinia striiformis f. sp. tritici PST-130]|nr:hypothetical protein H4Q26_008297 [Puccinia striiformis f. sp. tritici PST-130]